MTEAGGIPRTALTIGRDSRGGIELDEVVHKGEIAAGGRATVSRFEIVVEVDEADAESACWASK